VLAALLAAVALVLAATPGRAAPADPEGGTKKLRDALNAAVSGHVEAKNKLANSRKRQLAHQVQLAQAQQAAARLETQVVAVAVESYRIGRLSGMTMLLNSSTPDAFLERTVRLDMMAQVDARTLREYRAAVDSAVVAKKGIDREVKQQQTQVTVMARKKSDAERALATVGGATSRGFINADTPRARAAPRDSDGSWPGQGCTARDPTSQGCVTPRLLHAYQQTREAGFKRHTGCFSQRSSGEHPLGRACDFSAAAGGFQNVDARGGDRTYGDNLAAYLVRNADRLGVMYVIWYRQIWSPATGWRAYSGRGAPNATHTNHVHLSVL
jgi:hypothetical protein